MVALNNLVLSVRLHDLQSKTLLKMKALRLKRWSCSGEALRHRSEDVRQAWPDFDIRNLNGRCTDLA